LHDFLIRADFQFLQMEKYLYGQATLPTAT